MHEPAKHLDKKRETRNSDPGVPVRVCKLRPVKRPDFTRPGKIRFSFSLNRATAKSLFEEATSLAHVDSQPERILDAGVDRRILH